MEGLPGGVGLGSGVPFSCPFFNSKVFLVVEERGIHAIYLYKCVSVFRPPGERDIREGDRKRIKYRQEGSFDIQKREAAQLMPQVLEAFLLFYFPLVYVLVWWWCWRGLLDVVSSSSFPPPPQRTHFTLFHEEG